MTAPPPHPTSSSPAEHAMLARRTLVQAVLLGVLADALLRDGPAGLGLLLWMLAFGAGVIALAWRRGTAFTREQYAWLAAAILFAGGLTWHDSEALQFYDFVAMVATLALLGMTMSAGSPTRSVLGTRVRDLAFGIARAGADAAVAVLSLVLSDSQLFAARQRLSGDRTRALLRAALITVPLVILFGALLSQADPMFGALFSLPRLDFEDLMSHVIIAGFFTWVTGGWMRGALVDVSPRRRPPDGFPVVLGSLEITIALGALASLFAVFVGVQIGWLFGGEALVRSTTGLGYAQYARRGFFELVWVSLLVLPVLLGTRAAIPETDATAIRRHRQLAVPVLLLLGAIMLSALGRMRLYVDYYGLTTDRLFATVFMVWLAIVFAWFAVTVLRGRGRDFAAGMTITGFLTLAVMNASNPEALIARVNVARAPRAAAMVDTTVVDSALMTKWVGTRRSPIDYSYLTRHLRGDAAPVVVGALVAPPVASPGTLARMDEVKARCDAVKRLLLRWGPLSSDSVSHQRDGSWRRWNLGAARARSSVREHEGALRAVTCWDDGREATFGTREQRKPVAGEQWYDDTAAR